MLSYARHHARLNNLFRRPLGTKTNPLGVEAPTNQGISKQQSGSNEYEDNLHSRDAWDSGEDYYFKWANENRRPVEYFIGRKREAGKVVLPPRDRRINGGLWRSGLVG